jgi:hypothetical protein
MEIALIIFAAAIAMDMFLNGGEGIALIISAIRGKK